MLLRIAVESYHKILVKIVKIILGNEQFFFVRNDRTEPTNQSDSLIKK